MDAASVALGKLIWSEMDYEQMGWHDVTVHALATVPEQYKLLFDLDYILNWVKPVPPSTNYAFWLAPATLEFNNVIDLEIHLDSDSSEIILDEIHRLDPQPTPDGTTTSWQWVIVTTRGAIRFRAIGYTQYIRSAPILTTSQVFTLDERGGISFACVVKAKTA
jgi:hypothetical protein